MSKIYCVNIRGRTLEGRNLRELLARAVSEKKNQDRKSMLQPRFGGSTSDSYVSNSSGTIIRMAMQ
jgi:hypothetical protein